MQSQQDQHIGISNGDGDVVMAEQTAKLQSKYGSLPIFSKGLLSNRRKYFDSGDYFLSKAGKDVVVGSEHPQPENIPHSVPLNPVYGSIPSRRGSLVDMNMAALQANNATEQQTV